MKKQHAHVVEPERQLYQNQNHNRDPTWHDKMPRLGEQPVWWGHYSKCPDSGLKGCELYHLSIPALEGPKSMPTWSFSLLYGVLERTNQNEYPVVALRDEL